MDGQQGRDERGTAVGYLLLEGQHLDILRDAAGNYYLQDARGVATEEQMMYLVSRYGGILWDSSQGFFSGIPEQADDYTDFTPDGLPRARLLREAATKEQAPGTLLPNWMVVTLLALVPLGVAGAMILLLPGFLRSTGADPVLVWSGALVVFLGSAVLLWMAVRPGGFRGNETRLGEVPEQDPPRG